MILIHKIHCVILITGSLMEEEVNRSDSAILMELNNGEIIKTPVLLSKALEIIDALPTSVDLSENYISFEKKMTQKIQFHRVFNALWVMELSFPTSPSLNLSLKHKYLKTRTVKAIVINFFYGIFLGTVDFGIHTSIQEESRIQFLRKAIDLIDMKLKKCSLCKYCGRKLPYNFKEKCDYCGVELNFAEILLK